ncbi:hypothetical protein BGX30_002866 [Mortierella sp. GBA39]|nr:hypothetical protein BGX30_002866 [Mortierella sp. GBA39]
MFGNDLFWKSVTVTLRYTLISVPIQLLLALGFALLLNQKIPLRGFFRTAMYFPSMVSGVAMSLLWYWIFNPQIGLFNYMLSWFGIKGPAWLMNPDTALYALMIMSFWTAGSGMILFLAGLQGVPASLVEAAKLDGAGRFKVFLHVTLPMISPVLLFQLIMGMIDSFQVFTQAFVMTQGGPNYSTWFYVYNLYTSAFKEYRAGYSSALAWMSTFPAAGPHADNAVPKRRRSTDPVGIVSFIALVVTTFLMLLPLFFMVSTSLKSKKEMLKFPPTFLPESWQWSNYKEIFDTLSFGTMYMNSLMIGVLTVIGTLLSSALAAYGFARYRGKGSNTWFLLMLSTMMLPYPAIMIPQFILFSKLNWIDTFLPLIVPAFFGSAYNIFLLRQFFSTLPEELFDAGRIDGCSEFRIPEAVRGGHRAHRDQVMARIYWKPVVPAVILKCYPGRRRGRHAPSPSPQD